MSIWRAPLLILGVLLILLAAGAVALPWLVDFNRYKPQLQRWASEMAGREVRIEGDVRLALFPWPAAQVGDVSVAGVADGRHTELLRVREVRARLSLAALLGGRLEVEHITLRQPVLMLEHLGDGRGNWTLQPRGGLRLPFSGERIRIDSVRVEGGQILLADHRLRRQLRIDNINATLSAPALRGPWRLSGAWRMLERAWRVRAATGVVEPGKPLGISLRMEPPEGEGGHLLRLEGELLPPRHDGSRMRLEGDLILQPLLASGRSDPLDPARQVEIAGRLRADADMLELADVAITPRLGVASPFDALRGNLRIVLGRVLNAELFLQARKLVLNRPLAQLLGLDEAVSAARAPEGLDALRRYLGAVARRLSGLPPELLLELDLQATEMHVEGRVFHRVAMSAEVSPELLAVHHLRADAPGKASLSFKGNLLGGDLLQLTGELDARSGDARALLSAIAPDAGVALSPLWRGRGGRLRLLATLDLTDQALRLVSRRLSLDDATLRLDWRLHEADGGKGARRHMLRLAAERFDTDRHLGAAGADGLPDMLAQSMRRAVKVGGAVVDLHLQADNLRLAGQDWRGVVLALLRRDGEIVLRELKVANVAGLTLGGSGEFRRQATGWRGGLKMRLRGSDGEAVRRLLPRVLGDGGRFDWLASAGAVDVQAMLQAGAGSTANGGGDAARHWLEVALDGHAGGARLSLSARGALPEAQAATTDGADAWNWRAAEWHARGELRDMPAAALLRLLGLRADMSSGKGMMRLWAQGVPVRRMEGELELAVPGTEISARGWAALPREAVDGSSPWPPLQGEARVRLALEDVGAWRRLVDLALPYGVGLQGGVRLAFSPGVLKLSKMALRSGDNRVAGELSLRWPEASVVGEAHAEPLLHGKLVADVLDPALALTALLGEVDAPMRWRRKMAAGRELDIVLRADKARLPGWGLVLPDAKLELKNDKAGEMHVVFRAGAAGRALRVQGTLRRDDATLLSDGELRADLPLQDILRTTNGAVRLTGTAQLVLKAQGRSATLNGWLAGLRGEGELRVHRAHLLGISPQRLVALARGIAGQEEFARFDEMARTALFSGKWPLPGPLRVKLKLADGLLESAPLRWRQEGVETVLSGLMDIAERKLDVAWRFAPDGTDAPPPFEVVLAGLPGAMALSADWAVVHEWVQQRLLRRQEEELKRLEEARARREALARKLEEDAARAVRDQQQQEELRQRARRLHEQLQEVLGRAYGQMREQGSARKGEEETSATVEGVSAAPVSPGAAEADKTLEVLIRQALEDDRLEQDNVAAGAPHRLPEEARAQPRGLSIPSPRPRARPRGNAGRAAPPWQRSKNSATGNGNSRNGAVRQRTAPPEKASARPVAGKPAWAAAKAPTKAAARPSAKPAARAGSQGGSEQKPPRRISPPLTNWNRLVPASP